MPLCLHSRATANVSGSPVKETIADRVSRLFPSVSWCLSTDSQGHQVVIAKLVTFTLVEMLDVKIHNVFMDFRGWGGGGRMASGYS